MTIYSFLCWLIAFVNMVCVFSNLQHERYFGAAFNFVIAFWLLYQRVSENIKPVPE